MPYTKSPCLSLEISAFESFCGLAGDLFTLRFSCPSALVSVLSGNYYLRTVTFHAKVYSKFLSDKHVSLYNGLDDSSLTDVWLLGVINRDLSSW